MELIKSNIVYECKRFNVEEAVYKNDEGETITRFHVKSPEAVVVLPITKEGKIVFVKQVRTAIGNKMVIELPAGKVDPGENPRETAIRELHEETGYVAKDIEYILSYYPSNGLTDEKLHLFVTKNLEEKTLQELTEDEDIEVVEMYPEEAMNMILNHTQENGHSLIALLWYQTQK